MTNALLLYLFFLGLIYVFQDKLTYFPAIQTQDTLVKQANANALKLWPKTDYRGLIKQNDTDVKGTILVFHGNAGSAINRGYYVSALENLGYRVIIAEYLGYGARSGIKNEAHLVEDALQTAQLVLQTFDEPLYLWGESLGAGVATAVANSKLPIAGIVLVTPFDNLPNVAQHHYWYFFGKWLTKDNYDNVANLKAFKGNVAIIMAEQDEVIPNSLTLNLYNNIQSQKKLWRFANAGHNSLPFSKNLPWWQDVMNFITHDENTSVF
ncbi:MAG: alpha/beta fold hydrolase [Methylococcaceae bacterium]|nr:alpha/beta fold hydrolase [Methylococcaceae bacterium]